MKLYLMYLVSLKKNSWFYFCEFMAILAIIDKAFWLAIMFGVVFPVLGITKAYCMREQ